MVPVGFGLAIVIADDGGNDIAVSAFQTGNVAIQGQVFAVFVVPAVADAMAQVVKKGPGFELDTCLNREMVQRLELVKEHEAELANMLGVALVVFQAAAETARTDQYLASVGIVAMRLFAGEGIASDFLKETFAEADAGYGKGADVEITAEGDEDQGGNGHDIGAIAADSISFHARANIAL